jgi:glutaredoxin
MGKTEGNRMTATSDSRTATLYRMVMPDHLCPYGLKAKDLLEREGYEVRDEPLESPEETEAFKKKHGVESTPQVFISGQRIGGYEALRKHLGHKLKDADETSYTPVIALFSLALAISLAICWLAFGTVFTRELPPKFVAVSMCLLALQKLQDVETFSTMFLNYDLLARRWVRYGCLYPFGEGVAGVLMLAAVLDWISVPIALFIGTVGAVSVFKAVYIDKRELKCACVGGHSKVPLGLVSLTENLMMIAMGCWMILT